MIARVVGQVIVALGLAFALALAVDVLSVNVNAVPPRQIRDLEDRVRNLENAP